MFKQDYMLKQIAKMIEAILKIFFDIDMEKDDSVSFDSVESDLLLADLRKMASEGEIGAAEDRLFDAIDNNPSKDNMKIALLFYDYLNEFEDEFLEEHDFSRKEIDMGLRDCLKIYKMQDDVEKMLDFTVR